MSASVREKSACSDISWLWQMELCVVCLPFFYAYYPLGIGFHCLFNFSTLFFAVTIRSSVFCLSLILKSLLTFGARFVNKYIHLEHGNYLHAIVRFNEMVNIVTPIHFVVTIYLIVTATCVGRIIVTAVAVAVATAAAVTATVDGTIQ